MIDVIEKATGWVKRWQEVTFSPSHLFSMEKFKLDAETFWFATGCLLSGYLLGVIGSELYFGVFFPKNMKYSLSPTLLKGSIEIITVFAGLYVAAILMGVFIISTFSYWVYRRFGSKRTLSDHFACELNLFNLEPIAVGALTVCIICYIDYHYTLGRVLLSLFLCTRLYYIVLSFIAFRCLHSLSLVQERWAFGLGVLPPVILDIGIRVCITGLLALMLQGALDQIPKFP
jgi:hypothetical protein